MSKPLSQPESAASLLPLHLPEDRVDRIVLVCIRRMAAHGIRDAHAAWLALDTFGVNFRRPLVLLRAFLMELAQASQRSIKIAPCCAMRMTEDEGRILQVLRLAHEDLHTAEQTLAMLTDNPYVCEPLSAAAVFGRAIGEPGPAHVH